MPGSIRAVLIDSREPGWVQSLKFGSAPVTVQALPAGDAYIAAEDALLLVERKTPADLLASIADERVFEQIRGMSQQTPWVYVVICGILDQVGDYVRADGKVTAWRWNALQGALLTIQELGAAIICCANDREYGKTLECLASHKRGPKRVGAKRQIEMMTPAEVLLTALPGISEVRARALLQYCGSAAAALSFLTLSLDSNVPGIGPATKQATRAALGLTEDQVLEVLSTE